VDVRIELAINAKSPEVVERIRAVVEEFRAAGHEVHPRLTFEGGDARRFAREAAEAGADVVVAGGGDGTVNEVANGLHDHLERLGSTAGTAPRLAILPLGTANDLANTLGIPTEVDAALRTVLYGVPVEANVGVVNGRCFLNVSTGGFGAEATGEAPAAAKRALGTLAYLIEGVRRFAALQPTRAKFRSDTILHDGPFLLFAVGNSTRTGGGTELTPNARMGDDLLDVCIVKEVNRVEFLGLLPDLRSGDHLDHRAVIYRQVSHLEVDADVDIHVNVDGEPMRERSFRYTLSPHRLTLLVPRRDVRDAE
jgi:diacylglycerol kinase (ATP)